MKKNKLLIILLGSLVFFSHCETAFESDLAGKKPILQSPSNNLTTTTTSQTFYWEKMNGASTYQLQVVSPTFNSITTLIADTTITTNRFTIILSHGDYQWRVKANNSGSSSDFSETWNLKIQ